MYTITKITYKTSFYVCLNFRISSDVKKHHTFLAGFKAMPRASMITILSINLYEKVYVHTKNEEESKVPVFHFSVHN